VLGGVITFGFIGVFLGPVLLAVGYSLAHEILTHGSSAAVPKKAEKHPPDK
jgi:predicted PurR-regulated permease PerM